MVTKVVSLVPARWENGAYSLESEYSSSNYDIEIFLSDGASSTQKTAFDDARIVGCYADNTIKAYGEVPSIAIPIVIKAVKKI